MKIIVVGGGWAGCAAALQAAKSGNEVHLIERTDSLLGTGLVGGILRNNGRLTATQELIYMGGGTIFETIDANLRHRNINFPGHEHADLYDVVKMPRAIRSLLDRYQVTVHYTARISKLLKKEDKIISVTDDAGNCYEGDAFIDATGTAGPMANCARYGNGCSMCILRCPSFGGRISVCSLAGIKEISGVRKDGLIGAMSGSCKILKESLSKELQESLNTTGFAVVPVPPYLIEDHLALKCCQQYTLNEYRENLILLDTGHAKLMTPYFPIEKLHKIPGFYDARYEDPYAGGKGNSMRFFAVCPCNVKLQTESVSNLFCAGEKAGLFVGHTEAIITGTLAGYNASAYAANKPLLTLPRSLCCGEAIAYGHEEMQKKEGLLKKYTFSGSCFFDRMKALGLYTTDYEKIKTNVKTSGMENIYSDGLEC